MGGDVLDVTDPLDLADYIAAGVLDGRQRAAVKRRAALVIERLQTTPTGSKGAPAPPHEETR